MAIETTKTTTKQLLEKMSYSLKHSIAKVGRKQDSELFNKSQISRELERQKLNRELSILSMFMRMY